MEELVVSSFVVENLNFLNEYDPMVIKLVVILFSIGLIYFIRKLGFDFLE